MHPTDELAQILDDIRSLEMQAANLRSILAMQRNDLCGATHQARFQPVTRQIFVLDELPPEVLCNPTYWVSERSIKLSLDPVENPVEVEDAYPVIEPWNVVFKSSQGAAA